MKLLLVMIGGFLGAICRFSIGEWISKNNGFPLSTFIINMIGCFILGWFLTFANQTNKVKPAFTLMIGTGFIGSFTTFSTFSVETLHLLQKGLILTAILYVFASTVVGIGLAYAGHKLAIIKKEK
ncbi:fluoride efflux transporter CrcB [Calidifontibacillus erzurumensis]|uniref:fluoride efflux transporter CrcB n=1 Tax=Calidifontibacillus erzurumensis TaxID=2741433 RepID=UPI0035B4FDFF